MSEDDRKQAEFATALHMACSDLHEAALSFRIAAELESLPTDPKALRMLRTDLEKVRRLLHTCLMYVDNIERSALDLDEDDPYLP